MAHVAKFKSSGVGPMVGHYAREAELRGYARENIDPSRTPLNYEIGNRGSDHLAREVRERVSGAMEEHVVTTGRAVRCDANVMMDWVVTAPRDLRPGDERRFFETVVAFIQDRYGRENVPGGFVHMDEATPHAHVPVIPVRDGRLAAAKVINRADLLSFHGGLGRSVDAALGYHVSIELDGKSQGEKQLSHLSQSEYIAAKDEMSAAMRGAARASRRASEARREADKAEEALGELRGRLRASESRLSALEDEHKAIQGELSSARAACDDEQRRLECLQQTRGRAAERVEALESIAADARSFEHAPRARRSEILDRIARACDGLAARVRGAIERVEEAVRAVAPSIARLRSQIRLRSIAEDAIEAARHVNAGRGGVGRGRGGYDRTV